MKKVHIKFFCIVIMFSIILSSSVFSQDYFSENDEVDVNIDKYLYEKIAIENHKEVLNFMQINSYIKTNDYEYPNHYAGAYFNGKELIVYVTDYSINGDKEIVSYDDLKTFMYSGWGTYEYEVHNYLRSDLVKIEKAQYSYNFLNEVMDKLNAYFSKEENQQRFPNVVEYGIDAVNNCIKIKIIDIEKTYNAINEVIKKITSNADCIIYENLSSEHDIPSEQRDIRIGEKEYGGVTIGFRCNKDGEMGYVTTYHKNIDGRTMYDVNGVDIGTVKVSKYNEYMDYAFFEANLSNVNPLRSVAYPSDITYLPEFVLRMYIGRSEQITGLRAYLCGGESGGINSGTIVSPRTSITQGATKYDLVSTDYACKKGDSGGAVFHPVDHSRGTVLGIHVAGTATQGYYYPVDEIISNLGIEVLWN